MDVIAVGNLVINGLSREMTEDEAKVYLRVSLLDRESDHGLGSLMEVGLHREASWKVIEKYVTVMMPSGKAISPAVRAFMCKLLNKPEDAALYIAACVAHMTRNHIALLDIQQFARMIPNGIPTEANLAAAYKAAEDAELAEEAAAAAKAGQIN